MTTKKSNIVEPKFYVNESLALDKSTLCYLVENTLNYTSCLEFSEQPCLYPWNGELKEEDIPHLLNILSSHGKINTIYLIPNDIKKSLPFADILETHEKFIYLMELPDGFFTDYDDALFLSWAKKARSPFQILVDDIYLSDPDPERLPEKIGPLKEKLASLPPSSLSGCLDYLKKTFKVKGKFIDDLRREVNELRRCNKLRNIYGGDRSIFELNGQLCKAVSLPGGATNNVPITSFLIHPVESIEIPGEGESLRCILKTISGREFEVIFPPECWGSIPRFINTLHHKEAAFFGNSIVDVQNIRHHLSKMPMPTKTGVRMAGYYESKDIIGFITEDGCLTSDGIRDDIAHYSENRSHCKLISHARATEKELKEISKYIMKFNAPSASFPLLGWTIACFFKPVIQGILDEMGLTNGFPLLNVVGECGAGKTSAVQNILMRIWALQGAPKSINSQSAFTMMWNVSSSNMIPLILEENKGTAQSKEKQDLISNTIRNTYNCLEGDKGKRTLNIIAYRHWAPVCIDGEQGFSEPALLDRFTFSVFAMRDSSKYLNNFIKLRELNLEGMGRVILEKSLSMSKQEITEGIKEALDQVDTVLTGRPRVNAAIPRFGLRVLETVLSMDHVNGDPIDQAIRGEIFEDGSLIRKSAVDKIIEKMSMISMYRESKAKWITAENVYRSRDHLEPGIDYEVNERERSLKLWVSGAYPVFRKWAKSYSFEGEILPENTFKSQLKRTSYFIDNKNARIGGTQRNAYILSLDKMITKGLEINESWLRQ